MRDARELAERLRDDPPSLDDLSRARMEKALLAGRPEERALTPEPALAQPKRWRPRTFAAGLSLGLAVAAAVALWMRSPVEETRPAPVVRFEAFSQDRPVRAGAFAQGETISTEAGQRLVAGFAEGEVEVEVRPRSRVRFEQVGGEALAVAVDRGEIRVVFHPQRRGSRTLAVETPFARVEVIGTSFTVRVVAGATEVTVEEGLVRVVPREGDERFVRGGESTVVGVPELEPELEARASAPPGSPDVLDPRDPDTTSVLEQMVADLASAGGALGSAPSVGRDRAVAESREADAEGGLPEGAESAQQVAEVAPREEATAARPAVEAAPSGRPLDAEPRFELALRHMDEQRYAAARHELHAIIRTTRSRATKARAWTDVAVTHFREGDTRLAAEAYRRAATTGQGTSAGADALFALGQMRLALGEEGLARAAFVEYLEAAPNGPLAGRARRTLCRRLGVVAECSP